MRPPVRDVTLITTKAASLSHPPPVTRSGSAPPIWSPGNSMQRAVWPPCAAFGQSRAVTYVPSKVAWMNGRDSRTRKPIVTFERFSGCLSQSTGRRRFI